MGFCRLLKIILSVSVVTAVAAGAAAETHGNSASASIQVTATVVPSLGMREADDMLAVTASETGELMMHYPSTGVLLSVENGSAEPARLSLNDTVADTEGPGAVLVDLERILPDAATETGDIVLTVIYTEN